MAQAFKEGAESEGHKVETISLKQNHVAPCIGCCQCQVHGECFMKDKLNEILDKIIACDVLVFASPTYYYGISGNLKNFIDRTFAKFTKIKNKDFYYIGSSTDSSKDGINRAVQSVKGFLDCVDNVILKGVVYGTGLTDVGDAKFSPSLRQSYELGKKI